MKKIICLLIIALQFSACATYEKRAVSFKPPQEYANFNDTSGLLVGAEAISDIKQAESVFGFDIRGAGLLPVQLVIDNKSGQDVEVVTGQTFLIDNANNYWKMLPTMEAAERVRSATETGTILGSSGKGAAWGAAAGALVGLAVGIVSGHDIGSSAAKGGAVGGAGGAVLGGTSKGGEERQREMKLAGDIGEKGIEGKTLAADSLASGFIFFPGEIESAKELRLQIKFRNTGAVQTITMKIK